MKSKKPVKSAVRINVQSFRLVEPLRLDDSLSTTLWAEEALVREALWRNLGLVGVLVVLLVVGAITRPDIRWSRCDIKSIALLPNVLAVQAAREQNCNEVILHRDGRVTTDSENYRVVGNTLIVNRGDYLVNYKFNLQGNTLTVDTSNVRAILARM